MKKCIGVLIERGVGFKPSISEPCGRFAGPRNPYWCNECDDKRIARITESLEEISRGYEGR